MGSGGVWAPPYSVVIGLLEKIDDEWREFDGWSLAHGQDMQKLSLVRVLNLFQHWWTDGMEEKDLHKVRSMMRGPLETTITDRKPVDPSAPKMPPRPWWFGDDESASASALAATRQLR